MGTESVAANESLFARSAQQESWAEKLRTVDGDQNLYENHRNQQQIRKGLTG